MPSRIKPLHWGRSTVETGCPLDCPDCCSLAVTVEEGRIVKIGASARNPTTGDYICAKVRNFDRRVYGEARVRHPLVRSGAKGSGKFSRVGWDEALQQVAGVMERARRTHGGEAILPLYYGGSNGLVTQETADAELFRGLGASRLARTVCAAATGAAHEALYGRMPGVAYEDYAHARLIVVWGANPSASGIHLVPIIRNAQRGGARLVVVDPRRTKLARMADIHLAVRPGSDVVVALAVHRHLFEERLVDDEFLEEQTVGAERLRQKALPWTFQRAAQVSGVAAADLEAFADLYANTDPAVIRCGWGLERNRNGGNGVMAVLALPAVAGKFGVRGGGFTMSNSAAWRISSAAWIDTPETGTRVVNMNHVGRALTEYKDPPITVLFVYNANPLATLPDQNRVLRGLLRDDLFTVVFEQVMTDTAMYADVVLPATTFLETYDIAKGYGAYALQLVKPVIDAVGEARPNVEVFGELARLLGVEAGAKYGSEAEAVIRVAAALPGDMGTELMADRLPAPPDGATPVQFVDVFPRTNDGKVHLFSDALDEKAPAGLYGWQPDPASDDYPLALISPASEKTISSTLGELRVRPAALYMHPEDARERDIQDGDTVRVFNAQGEVQCLVALGDAIVPGTVSLPKGLWRRSTLNESTANALVPDTLTDLGGGACFNDARVQVVRVMSATLDNQNVAIWVGATSRADVPHGDVH